MSKIPLDVLKAASELNRDRYVKAILEGDSERASEHLHKMTYALQQIEQYQTLCGDHIVPIGECGCKI